ncbi:MAG: hypothetical protein A2W09_07240 [Deltaproteobacteria bacterium RBG_16_50_11]|nr:MAG: hypothetical protein A2W09_07240 [Deltaproteobacteria bacterium RBG_16_50_11]
MLNNINRYLLGLQSIWLLAGLIPTVTIACLSSMEMGFLPFAAFLIVLVSSLRLSIFSIQNEKRIISMTFWIYVYIFLGLSPLLQLLSRHLPLEGSYKYRTIVTSFFIIFYGLLSYESGWWFGSKNNTLFTGTIRKLTASRYISSRRTFFLSFFSLIGTIFIILNLGGMESILLAREEQLNMLIEFSKGENQVKLQILSMLLKVPIFISLILLWTLWHQGRRTSIYNYHFNFWKIILLVVIFVINLFVNNPVSSARYWFGTIVLSLLFLTIRWRSKKSFAIIMAAITVSFILVFPLADTFRYTTNLDKTVKYESSNRINFLVEKGDYDSFQQILNTTEYVEDKGISFGKQMFGTIMFWVPRNLWSSKPVPSGMVVAEHKGYEYTNLSLPLWGEAYMDGGIPGVILVFVIYGYIISTIEKLYLKSYLHGTNFLNIFVPVYAAYQFFLLRGTLMSAFAYFIPLVIFIYIGTKRECFNNGKHFDIHMEPRPREMKNTKYF